MVAPGSSSKTPPVLETARLVLRPLAAGDAADFHGLCNDREVARYLLDGEPVSMETARALVGRSGRAFAGGSVGLFGICRHNADGLIGFCGFFVVEGVGEPELTYGLLPPWWGHGFASEAASAVARHALEEAGFRRVLVATDEANTASTRVVERLGAKPIGKIVPAPPGVAYFEIKPRPWGSGGALPGLA